MLRKAMDLRFLLALITMATMAEVAPAYSAAAQRLVYSVHHSRFGNIGTYSNAVEKTGNATTVTTDAHFQVSILGVVLFRQDAARQERWNGDRLVAFHGVTTTNGRAIELNGAAQGDRFVMMTPDGVETVAPASVRLANPWSPDVLRGDTMLTPDRGRMENIQIIGGEETSVAINGRNTRTKRYEINRLDGQKRYEIWMDDRGTPVMFNAYTGRGIVTFTLSG
jgi:hypothetical protein